MKLRISEDNRTLLSTKLIVSLIFGDSYDSKIF